MEVITLSRSCVKSSWLLSSTKLSQTTSSIHPKGFGCTELRSNEAPPCSTGKLCPFMVEQIWYLQQEGEF